MKLFPAALLTAALAATSFASNAFAYSTQQPTKADLPALKVLVARSANHSPISRRDPGFAGQGVGQLQLHHAAEPKGMIGNGHTTLTASYYIGSQHVGTASFRPVATGTNAAGQTTWKLTPIKHNGVVWHDLTKQTAQTNAHQ